MKKIYEIRDVSDEERYYSRGLFSSLKEAKGQLTLDNIEKIRSEFTEEDYDLKFEILERPLNCVTDDSPPIFEINFDYCYDEEKDENCYRIRNPSLPNSF